MYWLCDNVCDVFPLQDYKTYLDFVLAMENRKEPQARLVKPSTYVDQIQLLFTFTC